MTKRFWSRSIKKYLRREKSRIRAAFSDPAEQKRLIHALYDKFALNPIVAEKANTISEREK